MSSIRLRLLVPLVVGLALLLLLGSLALYVAVSRTLEDGFDGALVEKARALGSRLSLEIDPEIRAEATRLGAAVVDGTAKGEDVSGPRDTLLDLARRGFLVRFPEDEATTGPVEHFEIRTDAGRTIARTDVLDDSGWFQGAHAEPHLYDLALPDGRKGRLAVVRVDDVPFRDADWQSEWSSIRGGAVLPELQAVVAVAEGREALERVLQKLRLALAGLGLAFIAGAVILVLVVLRRGLSPLTTIERRLKALDAGSLGRRIEIEDPPAELRTVLDALNEALSGLDDAFARERRTTANIAHELRTPIAELRSLMEVAAEFPDDAELTQQSLTHGREIALHMTRIVSALLRVTRLESGQETVQPEPVELAPLLASRWALLDASARERGQALEMEIADGLALEADPEALALIVANLLENAVQHAPAGSTIRAVATVAGGRVELTLVNPAPDIGAMDLEQGGLGLPLAAQLARAAGLGLDLARVDGRFEARIGASPAITPQGST